MGLKEDAVEAADADRGTSKTELHDTTMELREKFAEWCAMMGIEKVPSISVTDERYDASSGNAPEMDFRTTVDDIDLTGHYVRGDKLRVTHGDDEREINSLADLGRSVRREEERRE